MKHTVIIRTDASVRLGSGHVMRCLVLARLLREQGSAVVFVCREEPGHMIEYIRGQGFRALSISPSAAAAGNADVPAPWADYSADASQTCEALATSGVEIGSIGWMIVDHYSLDAQWEAAVRRSAPDALVLVIDDLADRPHECDVLLDQNYYLQMDRRYAGLVPGRCRQLLGPAYLLLRPEFAQAGQTARPRTGHVRRLLVFYGGSDPTGETGKALQALGRIGWDGLQEIEADIIVGQANPQRGEIERICRDMRGAAFHCQIADMAAKMTAADLSLGAGGVAMWERCYLGLPSIVTVVAANQAHSVQDTAQRGIIWSLGWHEAVGVREIADAVGRALSSPGELRGMGERAAQLLGQANENQASGMHPILNSMREVAQSR